jgi:small-conductance mechanosensitive channel
MASRHLFDVFNIPVYWDDLIWLLGIFVFLLSLFIAFQRFFIPFLRKREDISRITERKGIFLLVILLVLIYLEAALSILDIEGQLFGKIGFSLIVEAMILLVSVYLILWLATNLFIHQYFIRREKAQSSKVEPVKRDPESSAIKALKWLLFSIAVLILLQYIDWDYTFWTIQSPKEGSPPILIRISSVINILIIFLVTRLFNWILTQLILHPYYNQKQFDQGIRFSINTLLSYLTYLLATIVALRSLGMDIGLLLGGAAALLVGVGLALQSTFSDFFSGLVLLFERPIGVGDYVFYENKTVQVQKIGLRATKVKDRDSVNFIIPNSKMISQTVKNWSYDEKSVRFQVTVGVAYGSDTRLVEQILMQAADEHPDVLKRPKPKVVFYDFGSSSLDFVLNFYSRNIYNSDWVKSDLRFRIDELFREHKITIPFPQRDVWFKNEKS